VILETNFTGPFMWKGEDEKSLEEASKEVKEGDAKQP
jgi:hypothetical protein